MWGLRAGTAALLLAVSTAAALPARAQEADDGSTTTTTSPHPPPTWDLGDWPEQGGDGGDPTTPTTVPPDAPTTVPDPAANGDAPPETVPQVDLTVPPRTTPPPTGGQGPYADQPRLEDVPGRVVRVSSRVTRARAAEAQARLDAALARRDVLAARRTELQRETAALAVEERRAIVTLELAQLELERRAADAYIRGNLATADALVISDDAGEYAHIVELLDVVVEADAAAVRRYREAREAVDDEQADTAEELVAVTSELAAAEEELAAAQRDFEIASRELAVFLAGGELVIHGFVFPVAQPHNFVDTFGAPRMTGTEYEHWHEGTDIFAPMGTELLAAERGVITRMRTGGALGGNTIWLLGESGTAYYYAHLSGFAPGVQEGMVVEAATVVGYVGDTGNARGTPPHLHFEVHPGGGAAINPAPILQVADGQPQPEPIRLQ